jgi:hypothetical protein
MKIYLSLSETKKQRSYKIDLKNRYIIRKYINQSYLFQQKRNRTISYQK